MRFFLVCAYLFIACEATEQTLTSQSEAEINHCDSVDESWFNEDGQCFHTFAETSTYGCPELRERMLGTSNALTIAQFMAHGLNDTRLFTAADVSAATNSVYFYLGEKTTKKLISMTIVVFSDNGYTLDILHSTFVTNKVCEALSDDEKAVQLATEASHIQLNWIKAFFEQLITDGQRLRCAPDQIH